MSDWELITKLYAVCCALNADKDQHLQATHKKWNLYPGKLLSHLERQGLEIIVKKQPGVDNA